MGYLLELCLILLCSLGLSAGQAQFMWTVCALLFGMILILLALAISLPYVNIGIFAVGTLAVILLPETVWFLPVFLYIGLLGAEETSQVLPFKITFGVVSILVVIVALQQIFTGNPGDEVLHRIFLLVLILVVTYLLEYRSHNQEILQHQLLQMQDDTKEEQLRQRMLRQKAEEQHGYEMHLATLSERNRIAREMHDTVGHLLSRSLLQLGAIMTINKNETLQPFLQELRKTLDEAMTGVRSSVHDLHNESIDLEDALSQLIRPMEERFRIQFDYDVTSQPPRPVKYTVLGVVKEALSNVVKHSDATQVHVLMREQPAFYQLVVEDNGTKLRGKPFVGSKQEGIGLVNMRDRVTQHGGTLTISTENGFRIFIMLPKQEKEGSKT